MGSQNPPHLLRRGQMQKTYASQGDAVQEGQRLSSRSRQAALRSQAEGIRRSDQAHLQEEGQDDEEDRATTGVHRLQALRTRRRKEEEGPDAPVLRRTFRDDAAAVFWDDRFILNNKQLNMLVGLLLSG